MSADPYRGSMDLANPGSLNRYAYASNDPVNSNDPTGLCVINGQEYPDPCFRVITVSTGGGRGHAGGGAGGGGARGVPSMEVGPEFEFGGGGQGGGTSMNGGIAHKPGSDTGPSGYSLTMDLLKRASANCLRDIGATSRTQAVNTLRGSTIKYVYGGVPIIDATGRTTNGAAAASANEGTQTISINLNFGWMNPAKVAVQTTSGGYLYIDQLLTVGTSIGQPSLSATQYDELVLLHELGHLLGTPQEEADSPYNRNIFTDCIKR
jgi:hypothetical protein